MTQSTNCIKCDFHSKTNRDFYIDEDQVVWPCCHYANESKIKNRLRELDNKLHVSLIEDPDWNNISKHSIKDIINNKIYAHDIYIPGWESNPTKLCIKTCGGTGEDGYRFSKLVD